MQEGTLIHKKYFIILVKCRYGTHIFSKILNSDSLSLYFTTLSWRPQRQHVFDEGALQRQHGKEARDNKAGGPCL